MPPYHALTPVAATDPPADHALAPTLVPETEPTEPPAAVVNTTIEELAREGARRMLERALAAEVDGLEHIELSDFQRVESGLLHELDLAFFEDRFEGAAPSEQSLLLAMAGAGGRASLARLVAEAGEIANVPVGLRRLIDRGLVYRPTRATYDFALPLFGPYLRRRAKITKLSFGR